MALLIISLSACSDKPLNHPHDGDDPSAAIRYASFDERPKTLDPARAYSSNESRFIGQILEPPLQYDYLARPYQLTPQTTTALPTVTYYDKDGKRLSKDAAANTIATSVYDIHIKPGIRYQNHPAFAQKRDGSYRYHHLSQDKIDDSHDLSSFPKAASRELQAADYVYQLKRLASPKTGSPIYSLMKKHILGLENLRKTLSTLPQEGFVDLRNYALTGAKVLGPHHYQITVKGKYPQFAYWLAMPFFSPIPWEADAFYSQPGLDEHNISFDWYPVGTGPFQLTVNDPNRQMVLERNPNYHGDNFPTVADDSPFAAFSGKPLPMLDKAIYQLEKEGIPRWHKFLQGYYDLSGVSADSFDQAIYVDETGEPHLTKDMLDKKISLHSAVGVSLFYLGFNMLDDVVGGESERARLLRQAISIALDYEEYIAIFLNGRGVVAQGPLPPGIFGYKAGEAGINPTVYRWQDGHAVRRAIEEAKALLAKAGYRDGRDPKTGRPLTLYYDVAVSTGPDDQARMSWMRKQFQKLGIELVVRATQYNRFQDKMRTGHAQLFSWGWLADYPDPENFLFLLLSENGKVAHGGENAANYHNPEYDALFKQMATLENGPERGAIIDKMVALLQNDAPWIFGFYPKNFVLSHHWNSPLIAGDVINNGLKYQSVHGPERARAQSHWNPPKWWPVLLAGLILAVSLLPLYVRHQRRLQQPILKRGD